MSVINKMLRDLDSRQAAGALPVSNQGSPTGMARGTLVVDDSASAGHARGISRVAALLMAMVLLVGAGAGVWWYWWGDNKLAQPPVEPVKVAAAPVPANSAPVVAVAPVAVNAVQPERPEPVMLPGPLPTTADAVKMPPKTISAPPVALASVPVIASGAATVDVALKMDSSLKVVPSLAATAKSTVIPAPSPVRQSPALDALAQAQSLWSTGSREVAMDLLRDALLVAERANLAGSPAATNALLASLARELARMELAEGQVSQALEMLTRLEPALSGFADIWAIRGNAAQRLGRHQESAADYLMALKLRPDEPRWMLGAAVSLAAQGQLAAAAELAEKARAGGVLSREVAAYLRQLGVPLRER